MDHSSTHLFGSWQSFNYGNWAMDAYLCALHLVVGIAAAADPLFNAFATAAFLKFGPHVLVSRVVVLAI
ncbi:hypothetical protein DCAR_0519013 [Daucus carota subsp. sativus]|uniref:Uncharacterized protein n=1 Tax=Daucus carota subsp. sativus TaxID=79200 RepID=A0A161ZYI4_DAUCS|nr:hypothetical protein DCAR_0519013 [Daucus carota subsp. sativus]